MVNAAPLHSFDCSREGLAYISGFLALKLSADFPDLGAKTSEISHIVGPSKFPWLSALSRGGLVQPVQNVCSGWGELPQKCLTNEMCFVRF